MKGVTVKVTPFFVLINMIVLRSVDEEHHVGILLYGTRLSQVA